MLMFLTNILSHKDAVARGEVLTEGGLGPLDEDDDGEDNELREVLDYILVRPHLRLERLHLLQRAIQIDNFNIGTSVFTILLIVANKNLQKLLFATD